MKNKLERLLTKLIKRLDKEGSNNLNGTYGKYKINIEINNWEMYNEE